MRAGCIIALAAGRRSFRQPGFQQPVATVLGICRIFIGKGRDITLHREVFLEFQNCSSMTTGTLVVPR